MSYTAHSVHSSAKLAYSFPSINDSKLATSIYPRESFLSKNLKLEVELTLVAPIRVKSAIGKTFKHSYHPEDDDPLESILRKNQEAMNEYKLELPFTRKQGKKIKIPSKVKVVSSSTLSCARGVKRPRQAHDDANNNKYGAYDEPSGTVSVQKTPIPNKTTFFSPSSLSKKNSTTLHQSTPVSLLKEAHGDSQRRNSSISKMKLLKIDKTVTSTSNENQDVDDSDYDDLACHAENIMRMAVDSTMLGSTFNASFSSTFSNTFNDSINGIHSKKKYVDFFNDDADSDRSVLESLKSRWSNGLDMSKATKIEINADDLQAAVGDS